MGKKRWRKEREARLREREQVRKLTQKFIY